MLVEVVVSVKVVVYVEWMIVLLTWLCQWISQCQRWLLV